jgi:3-(methylthio)propanoyl-CoA dehydrogenase
LSDRQSVAARAMWKRLRAAREVFEQVVDFVAGNTKASPNAVFAGSVPYLMLAGNWSLAGNWRAP